jgi:tol-pal system protein YbgF
MLSSFPALKKPRVSFSSYPFLSSVFEDNGEIFGKGTPMKNPSLLLCRAALAMVLIVSPAVAQETEPNPANIEPRLAVIQEQMRTLNGQIEQLGFAIRRLDQGVQRMQSDYDTRLTKLETSTPSTPSTPGIATSDASSDSTPMSAQDQYDHAFGLLRQANYDEAEKAFRTFIDKNPKDKLIDNAKYWYAETFYGRGHFAEAATAFGDAFQQNPKGTKAPDSLLKLAMSLAAIDKHVDACTALYELKTKYPNATSNVRSMAAEETTKLKCNAP